VVAVVATLVTMVPALTILARFAFRDVLLTGDFAAIDARVRDVWSGTLPLLGPYSNGFSHPGPLYFYVLAPLDWLFGGASWTIVAGGALLHIVAIALAARLAWRRGGLGLTLLVLATFALSTLGATDRLLLDPWNPHIAMPFFVLFVLQVWSVMVRDRWQLLGAAIVGSFIVQAHIGYAPLVLAALAVATACVLVDARRARESLGPWARPLAVSAACTFVLWLPPIVEQITRHPGNVTRIARYFRDSPDGTFGLRAGARTFAGLYRPVPGWLGGSDRFDLLSAPRQAGVVWLVVPGALLVASLLVARRRGLHDALRLDALVAVLAVAGVLALSRLKSGAWPYMSLWRIPLAILVLVAFAWTLRRAWEHPPQSARAVGIVLLGAVILGGVIPITRSIAATPHVASLNDDAAAILDQVRHDPPRGTVLVRTAGGALRGITESLVDVLDRDGVDVRVNAVRGLVWGKERVATPSQVRSVWIVTESGVRGALLGRLAGARVRAHTTPLGAAEERELTTLQLQVAAQLLDAGRPDLIEHLERADLTRALTAEVPGLDPATLARIAELDATVDASSRCRCWVVSFPSDQLPGGLANP